MRLTPKMRKALEYAARDIHVSAWPEEHGDRTIYALRRHGYVETFTFGLQMAQVVFGRHIVDRITEKGRKALAVHGRRGHPVR